MVPGAIHVKTKGSNVWLDDTGGRYMRMPLTEQGRERPEWSDIRAGALQDAVWHPMISWTIGPAPAHDRGATGQCVYDCKNCPGLMIDYWDKDGTPQTSWFPAAEVVRAQ